MDFQEVYDALNPAQKKAVDQVEGCVMVVAGPGTGKTQVMGARVANILLKTDSQADNILCLTFTDAATVALRNRLFQIIGSSAHRVNIYTYHAFCNMVIQDNKDLFGVADLQPLSDLERLEVLREIIDELPKEHVLKRYSGDIYYDQGRLEKLIGLMKKDDLTPQQVESLVKQYLIDIENSESFRYKRDSKYGKKGELKREYHQEVERMNKLVAASALYQVYQKKLASRKRYDYNDMILWVLEAFEGESDLLVHYQERYHYFLVDEYQDTNGAQNELLYKLISYWENPNVFVVGDDDQSIYKFQGANVTNIQEFYERYQAYMNLVVLTENYRSTPEILAASNHLISQNTERLVGRVDGLSKDIRSSHPEISKLDRKVEVTSYPNTYQEIIDIAQQITREHQNGTPFKEMAILYRNHSQSVDLMDYFQAEGIPFNVALTQDVLLTPQIRQLMQLLSYLHLESQHLDSGQHLIYEILHFNTFQHLTAFELARMATAFKKDRKMGWREQINAMLNHGKPDYMSGEAYAELKTFWSDVEYWLKEMRNVSLQSLVEMIMAKGGFVQRALASSDNLFEVQCLKTFYNFLKEETARKPFATLGELLNSLELLQSNNLGLNLTKVIHGSDGVNLMTVHRSKGLEFDQVYLMGCVANKWEQDRQNLPFNLGRIIPGEDKMGLEEEGRRLFYVGMTRAKKRLHISYSQKSEADKPLNQSVFVVEVEESQRVLKNQVEVKDSSLLDFFAHSLHVEPKGFADLSGLDAIDHELENFRMSATNLNSYLKCPVAFFYQNIIRVPSAKSESMTYGSAVHYALEALFNAKNQSPDGQFPPATFLVDRFKASLLQHQESFTKTSLNRRMEAAEIQLPKYHAHYLQDWEQIEKVETEVSFKNTEVDGVPIRGQIDKIEWKGTYANVVDYKTGKYANAKGKINGPVPKEKLKDGEQDHNKIYGGDYWRQIVFYKILLDQDTARQAQVSTGDLDFVEADGEGFHKVRIRILPEDVEVVRHQIKTAYAAIKQKAFDQGCEKDDCQWCQFNKHYLNKRIVPSAELLANNSDEMEER